MLNEDLEVARLSIDWADKNHLIFLVDCQTPNKTERQNLRHSAEDVHAWIGHLRKRFPTGTISVVFEQSRGALLNILLCYSFFKLYLVNPQTVSNFRKTFYLSNAKDDPRDTELLLMLLEKHRDKLRVWSPDTPDIRALQLLTESRRKLVEDRSRLGNRLIDTLKKYFPQAIDWAGCDIRSTQACDFFLKWTTLAAIQESKTPAITDFYKKHAGRKQKWLQERVAAIRSAHPLTEDPAIIKPSVMLMRSLVKQIIQLNNSIDEFDQEISVRFSKLPDAKFFEDLPGAGPALAPRMAVAFGSNRSRYTSAKECNQYFGTAPVTERSGQSKGKIHKRYAAPRFILQTFLEFASHSIPRSIWARAYYDQLRKHQKSHYAAVRALAYKWIRILYACWSKGIAYDEATYLQSLVRRNSPLAAKIA